MAKPAAASDIDTTDQGVIDPADNKDQGAGAAADKVDEPSLEEKALAAFDEGVTGEPAPKPKDKPADEEAAGDEGGDEGEEEAPPALDADTEKEIGTLGIKNEAAKERFRALTAKAKSVDAMQAQLAELTGLKDETDPVKIMEGVKLLRTQAEQSYELIEKIGESKASPQQFGAVMGYLQLVNSGDKVQMRAAYDAMKVEQEWLAKELGEAVPGVYNPLDEPFNKDLKDKVASGKLDEEDAIETAKLRIETRRGDERVKQTITQSEQQKQVEQAQLTAYNEVAQLCQRLASEDPDAYKARQPQLSVAVKEIQQKFPPALWEAKTEAAYLRIASARPATRKPAPARVRSTTAVGDRTPRDDYDALSMGIESATR